jgi:hypothetical protein
VYDYNGTDLTAGAYTVTVVDKGAAAPTYQTAVTGGATVTVGDF